MGGRSAARIIRRGRAGKMFTAVAVLRGVPAIHGTSRVAIRGTSRMAVILGIGRLAAAIDGTSKIV